MPICFTLSTIRIRNPLQRDSISDLIVTHPAGRRPTLRLLPLSAIDSGDIKNTVIEISETKGRLLFHEQVLIHVYHNYK